MALGHDKVVNHAECRSSGQALKATSRPEGSILQASSIGLDTVPQPKFQQVPSASTLGWVEKGAPPALLRYLRNDR